MKLGPTPEESEQFRQHLRKALLFLALLLIGLGFIVLAVPPDTAQAVATNRAFLGVGLLIVGFLLGLLSRTP
jgi:uncharacterized membrane protein HdeD (DUF308 family)